MALSKKIALALALATPTIAMADDDVELVGKMSSLQYFAHKTALSIDHEHKELARFYAHELEEYIEDAAKVETYDGYPVGKLVNSILMPAFETFEAALKKGDWQKASARFDDMLNSCNACHDATGHSYISIERSSENPFMQSFKPKRVQPSEHKK